ncbi:MAG: GNAT family N-acetyltransferase [Anaerolineae bacterium]|nr:GNAT family N-acetyltransferase [Anaerolineae bacterium]
MDKLSFRPFHPDDLSACAKFAADAWPAVSVLVPGQDVVKLMHGYVELARLPSTWLEVACVSGRTVGLLFGRVNSNCTPASELRMLFSSLGLGCKAIRGQYGRLQKPLTLLRKGVATGALVKRHSPEADAVVELFVVDSEHSGRGIGRALMDRFVTAAKRKGARVIALHTDQSCNWRFYEKYGFKRRSAFTEIVSSYLEGQNVEGYIYVIETDDLTVGLERR